MPEAVAVHKRMNMVSNDYNGQMITGNDCGPNFLTLDLQLRKTFNQEIDKTDTARDG